MSDITPEQVRQFLVARYSDQLQGMGFDLARIPETFDFLLEGTVDSLGILEMVSALEEKFEMEIDMTALDPEEMTILGPLARYVAEHAISKHGGTDVTVRP